MSMARNVLVWIYLGGPTGGRTKGAGASPRVCINGHPSEDGPCVRLNQRFLESGWIRRLLVCWQGNVRWPVV